MERVVSFFQHEEMMAKMERSNRRLWILCIILIVALLGTNAGWIYFESQWEYTQQQTEIEAEQEGDINIIGGGDVNYGSEGESQEDDQVQKTQDGRF